MAFMQRQITGRQTWLKVETTQGTEIVPSGLLGLHVRNSDCQAQPLTQAELDNYSKQIHEYCEGIPQSWENVMGHGARLSAPGYMDCTEWAVFDTVQEAEQYLDERYPDDEENEMLAEPSEEQETICPQPNLKQILRAVIEATEAYHKNDVLGRPWLKAALDVLGNCDEAIDCKWVSESDHGDYMLYSRIMEGRRIYVLSKEVPSSGQGGYFDKASALKTKGIIEPK